MNYSASWHRRQSTVCLQIFRRSELTEWTSCADVRFQKWKLMTLILHENREVFKSLEKLLYLVDLDF